MKYTIEIIRSSRKTLAIEVGRGRVIVRAPYGTDRAEIDKFILERTEWIDKHWNMMQERQEAKREAVEEQKPLTMDDIRVLADKALEVIPKRVAYYAPIVGVTYGKITIRNQRSRWGSCSSLGNLNFNCLLMLTPPEVLDSVVVHELCHRIEPNHSERFYKQVLRVFPNYWECDKWLKKNGSILMARMTGE